MPKPIVYLRNDPHDRLDLVEAGAPEHGLEVVDMDALADGGSGLPSLDESRASWSEAAQQARARALFARFAQVAAERPEHRR